MNGVEVMTKDRSGWMLALIALSVIVAAMLLFWVVAPLVGLID
jgi:hypothetical protein